MKKNNIQCLVALIIASLTMTACDPSSDAEYIPSRDCLITSVTMGTLKRTLHTKGSQGQDSTYTVSVNGALYPIYIDQVENRIYNADSLPVGTNVEKVAFTTFNVKNSVVIKSLATGNDTLFSATDSTDFSRERTFKVYSEDLLSSREYTMELRVHNEEADTFAWQRMAEGASLPLASFVESRTFCHDGSIYVFGQLADGNAQVVTTRTQQPDFTTATDLPLVAGRPVNARSVQYFRNAFYALAGNSLVRSVTGTDNWSEVGSPLAIDALAAVHGDSLYALADGKLYATANGTQWTRCITDTPDALPQTQMAAAAQSQRTDPQTVSLILTGQRDGEPVVWRHDLDLPGSFVYPWINLPQTEELGDYACPLLHSTALAAYDNAVVLTGVTDAQELAPFYVSRDYGRTWKAGEWKRPDLKGVTAVSAAVDADQYLWIVCSGKGTVYKGRINRLGWKEDPKRFEGQQAAQ